MYESVCRGYTRRPSFVLCTGFISRAKSQLEGGRTLFGGLGGRLSEGLTLGPVGPVGLWGKARTADAGALSTPLTRQVTPPTRVNSDGHSHNMFSAFKRSIAQISIFHNPSLPPSTNALAMLRAALSGPFPPGSTSKSPLKFDLDVIENAPPTADQISTILGYLPPVRDADDPHHVAALISSHPSSPSLPDRPHSPEGLVRLAQRTPLALKWPIVVDWTNGHASAGSAEGVKDILEYLRKRRDGEVKEEEDYQPKGWFS